ncbi:MAG TPA: hypothetical protein PLY70_01625 [Saprospiraceae bacterium]|nr:hypothetical protein [Saprospiraceae bacterium]
MEPHVVSGHALASQFKYEMEPPGRERVCPFLGFGEIGLKPENWGSWFTTG